MAVFLTVLVLFVGGATAGTLYLVQSLNSIPTFEAPPEQPGLPAQPLALPEREEKTGIETFLIFSTGSAGLDPEEAERAGIPPVRSKDADGLSDSLMLLVLDHSTTSARVLSVPRDAWIEEYETKVNALYVKEGPKVLAETVGDLTGLPVNHMVSVNFAAFADVTDAVGGVEVYVEKPIRDRRAGLEILETGCVQLDGREALAWVRSRYAETKDPETGRWRTDPSASDFGRIERQHAFLRQALRKLLNPQLVTKIPGLVTTAQDNLVIDDNLGTREILDLARAFSSADAEAVKMYTYPGEIGRRKGQSVVLLDEEAAEPVLAEVRGEAALEAPAPDPSTPDGTPPAAPESTSSAAPEVPEEPEQSPVPPAC